MTCSTKTSLKSKAFSKSVGSTTHWPRQEGELDLFPLIRLQHLLTKSILFLLGPFFHRGPRPVKRADNFDSSSYWLQSISVSTALFQVLWNSGPALPLCLHSAVKSPSISLAPHCSEHLTQKPAESHTSHHAPLVIHSFRRQGCGRLAPDIGLKADVPALLSYWWHLNINLELFFFLKCAVSSLWSFWRCCEATLPRLEVMVSLYTSWTWQQSNNALISNPISSQWTRKQASSNVHLYRDCQGESLQHNFPNFLS